MRTDQDPSSKSQPLKRINQSLSNLLQATNDSLKIQGRYSPVTTLAIMIGGIALAEVVAMIVIYFLDGWTYPQLIILDASLMTVIIFPLLYFLSFKPLLVQLQQRRQSESIIQARLRLMQYANTHTLDELLQYTLDVIESLTGSTIGFFHFLEADQNTLWLQAWSTNTLDNMCNAEGKDSHYGVEQAGVWADAVRQRKAIIHNNYAALELRKGTPEGHALVVREMVIPILRDNIVMAILGLGNKPRDYSASDKDVVSTFADFAWDVIERKRGEIALQQSEEKFRTFVDWTYDWEHWLDPSGKIVYTSPSCERITGYHPEELIADPDLAMRIVHPDDQQFYEEHRRIIHNESATPISIEFRIVSRDRSVHWIEHVCRPLYGPEGRYLGRRVSNRDITLRKQAEMRIIEQAQKELILNQTIQTIQSDIARDLHDTLGQNISFLSMNLKHLSEADSSNPTELNTQIQNMTKVADESYGLIRATLAILHSGDNADPLSLFTHIAAQFAERSSMQIDVTSQGAPQKLTHLQIRQLFYIYREALSNIEKYAKASRVTSEFLWGEQALSIVISDNGSGFDPDTVQKAGHYGLRFMRERSELLKGSFLFQSEPGQGTKITVGIPYEYEPILEP